MEQVGWTCCSRTDKGVHAATQVVSLRLHVAEGKEAELVDKINLFLPPDIRAFDIVKVPILIVHFIAFMC